MFSARKRAGGWALVIEWVPSPGEMDSKRSRLERGGLDIDPFSAFSVAANQLAESGTYLPLHSHLNPPSFRRLVFNFSRFVKAHTVR